jgi:alkylation response protein AidB-like acyl-CoA dehydrogenase
MGGHEQDTAELFFDGVEVLDSDRLGEEGAGFRTLMQELPRERLSIAISAVTAAELALSLTLDYAKSRRAFGKTLIEFQNTAFKLAELRSRQHGASVHRYLHRARCGRLMHCSRGCRGSMEGPTKF